MSAGEKIELECWISQIAATKTI